MMFTPELKRPATRAVASAVTALFALALLAGLASAQPPDHSAAQAPAQDPAQAPAQSPDVYGEFNEFARANFGASEPLLYEHFDDDLAIEPQGSWRHVSETSAVFAWETNLPAEGWVEYGETPSYGHRTVAHERPFFLHVHYLRGLQPGTEYHYRLVARDERGRETWSPDWTISTMSWADVIRVPDDMPSGPPYDLTSDGALYLVTADIEAPATAFNIVGDRIRLDLGGHRITYDTVTGSPDPIDAGDFGWYGEQNPCGVRTSSGVKSQIVNGTIAQGAGGGASDPAGFNPLFLRRPRDTEVAGLTLEYYGAQISGLIVDSGYGGNHVHHNVVLDRGTEILDRHQGLDAIAGLAGTESVRTLVAYNLIKRTRHRGIRLGSNLHVRGNEIYVDSWATNSYGLMYYSGNADRPVHDVDISRNRVFGTGYHPIGVGSGYHAHDIEVLDNYIHMQGQSPSAYRWPPGPGDPPGQVNPVNGIRYHKGPQRDVLYTGNTVVVKARGVPEEPALMRGLWITPSDGTERVRFTGNVIKLIAQNEHADGHAVAALGTDPDDENLIVQYNDNTIISNTCNVRFGDSYGHGGRHLFERTTLVRAGASGGALEDLRYATIKLGWDGWNYDTYGHEFIDSVFDGGASYEAVSFEGAEAARQDFSVLWSLHLLTDPGANVVISDLLGRVVADQRLADGTLEVALDEYGRSRDGRAMLTPHTVQVTNPGWPPVQVGVTMDQMRLLDLRTADTPVALYVPYAVR